MYRLLIAPRSTPPASEHQPDLADDFLAQLLAWPHGAQQSDTDAAMELAVKLGAVAQDPQRVVLLAGKSAVGIELQQIGERGFTRQLPDQPALQTERPTLAPTV